MNKSSLVKINTSGLYEKWIVFGLIGLYLVLAFIWHFNSIAPWDDDCVGRYFNAKEAINDPQQFISMWNRPLFIILFFIPFQISKHAILLMAVISAINAYALYLVVKKLKIENSFLIIPMLLFQTFFFAISRSALTEPLAATIITFGYLFYLNKKFLHFAIVGSLLPLARLELSVFLVIWAFILITNHKWKYIFILIIPSLIWSLAGTVIDGNVFWLFDKTLGNENTTNRYGHKDFWHYPQKFIYVIGPLVFYFFVIGFIERLYRHKRDLFLIWQFLLGFALYILFSWKLNMGQAAGFLRHLIGLSPLVAIIALYGYNYWLQSIGKTNHIQLSNNPSKGDNIKNKSFRSEKKEKYKKAIGIGGSQKQDERKAIKVSKNRKFRILFYSIIMNGISLLFFSKKLIDHHKISDITDYTIIYVLGGLTITFIVLNLIYYKSKINPKMLIGINLLLTSAIIVYTLVTEPFNTHNSSERLAIERVSNLYNKGYLQNYDCYVNHNYFFWVNDIDHSSEIFHTITKENLDQASDSSIIIWDSHYSHRLSGNVELKFFKNNKEYIELYSEFTDDKTFKVVIFQKINPKSTAKDILAIFNRFIAFAPESPSTYVKRGNFIFNRSNQFDKAILDYNKAIELGSNDFYVFFNRGLAYFRQNKFKEAKSNFDKSIALKPDNYSAHNNIGVCLYALGNFSDAIASYSKVIELNPDFDQVYYNRAKAYKKINAFEKALTDYTKAKKINPKDFRVYFEMGEIFAQMGKNEEACKSFQMADKLGQPNVKHLIKQYCKNIN